MISPLVDLHFEQYQSTTKHSRPQGVAQRNPVVNGTTGYRGVMRRTAFLTGILATSVIVCALAGCAPRGTSSSPTPHSPAATSPSPTKTAAPPTPGCPSTPGTATPAGAVTRATIDVDGDGRVDTEWLSDSGALRFGVTTATGATFSYALNTASPAPREGFVAKLNNKQTISIADDNRAAYIHVIKDCAFVQPKDSHGTDYFFDMQNLRGNGTGVGCSDGTLVGYKATKLSAGYTVKQTVVDLNLSGTVATNGSTSTIVTGAASSDPRVLAAQTISCGTVTVANGGVTLGG
jgi:hypothetical protein